MAALGILMLALAAFAFASAMAMAADDRERRPLRLHTPRLDPSRSTLRGRVVDDRDVLR